MKPARSTGLPDDVRRSVGSARRSRGWSQAEIGRRVGLSQDHISQIETGKISPRFSTLLDLVRVLDFDFVLIPRPLVPVVLALIRDHAAAAAGQDRDEERPLWGAGSREDEDEDDSVEDAR